MKKTRIVMGAMALTIAAEIIIACTKEKVTIDSQSTSEMITVSKEDDMSAYLKQFKEKMQSATKGDETLSLEDARWHLEAVLNYTYGDAGHQTTDIQRDTFYIDIPTKGEVVTLDKLNDAFNSLSTDVEKSFAACDLPEKSILAIQTEFDDDSKEGGAHIRVIMETRGLNPENSDYNEFRFGPTEYWYEDNGYGKCGPYVGECIETGAVQRLQSKINACIPHVGSAYGTVYFSSIESIEINDTYIYNYLEDPLSPYGYRVHYYGDIQELFPLCLSPDDLNYYLSEALKLIDEIRPMNKEIISMTNEYYDLVPTYYYFGYHHYTFRYGILNVGGYDEQ